MMSMSNTMGSMGSMGSLGTLGSMGSMGMNTMGMNTGFGTFGTGMESLYGGATQQAFGAYNPYGNGLFNFGSFFFLSCGVGRRYSNNLDSEIVPWDIANIELLDVVDERLKLFLQKVVFLDDSYSKLHSIRFRGH